MRSTSVICRILLVALASVEVWGGKSARERHNEIRQSIANYRGPVYRPSSWKTLEAEATLYGLASYKRRSVYYKNPDTEPTVCFNTMKPKQGTYAYFICPELGMEEDKNLCCNIEGEEECCSHGEKTWGSTLITVLFAVGAALFFIPMGCWLIKKKCG